MEETTLCTESPHHGSRCTCSHRERGITERGREREREGEREGGRGREGGGSLTHAGIGVC